MIFNESYNRADFIGFLKGFLPDFKQESQPVLLPNLKRIQTMQKLGASRKCGEYEPLLVFEAEVDEKSAAARIGVTQEAFRVLKTTQTDTALIAFHHGDTWRLSLLRTGYDIADGKVVRTASNPRRLSYLLGPGTKTNTPQKYLGGRVENLEELQDCFSVEVVNKEFYDEIAKLFQQLVGGERGGVKYQRMLTLSGVPADSHKYKEFAVRLIGRIVFCWFLKEKKSPAGVPLIPAELLSRSAAGETADYFHKVMEPLFFELLDCKHKRRKTAFQGAPYNTIPYLNGGLFSPKADDAAYQGGNPGTVTVPDEWFFLLFEVLERFNFTVDENTTFDAELSVDPEMLGRIFENLLAEINPETDESARKSTGSFYTPRLIVDFMVDSALQRFLQSKTGIEDRKLAALLSYGTDDDQEAPLSEMERKLVVKALSGLTVLDPACGSGAFPIGILQKVVYILQQADPDAELWLKSQLSTVSAELRHEIQEKHDRGNFDYIRKLGVIRESIFGLDLQTIATEIAKLRCFLSLIVDEDVDDSKEGRGIQPLPNLDFKFISANALVKLEEQAENLQMSLFEQQSHIDDLKRIRDDYFVADPEERMELKAEFLQVQNAMLQSTLQNGGETSKRYQQLSHWKPFDEESTDWFDPEWMFGVTGGFDILIANPPYIHLEHMKKDTPHLHRLYGALGYKTYQARGDIYTLFYERGVQLLRGGGILCYITSNKWMRAAYGEPLRGFFADSTNPELLIDFAGQQIFTATVDTNILLLSKAANAGKTRAAIVKDRASVTNLPQFLTHAAVEMPFTTGASWAILSPIEQSIKRKIEAVGTPLKDWDVSINYGIKTGCNEAFIINEETRARLIAADPKSAEIIRPILRGRDIRRYGYAWAGLYIIASHNGYVSDAGEEIPPVDITDYPAIKAHLDQFMPAIAKRTDKGVTPYNLRNCAYMEDFCKRKIYWGEFSAFPKFSFVADHYFTLNNMSMITGDNLEFILAGLNSALSAYYAANNSPFGMGAYKWYAIYVKEIPIVKPTAENIERIVPLVQELLTTENATIEQQIDDAIFDIIGLTAEERQYVYSYIARRLEEIKNG
jgi:hypothetical protein